MYHACYVFRVPPERVERFLQINSEAASIYLKHGAVSSTIARVTDGASRYGCLGLTDHFSGLADEQLFVGVDSFVNREQFLAAMQQIDDDARIDELYQEMVQTVDLSKTTRWEAEDVV